MSEPLRKTEEVVYLKRVTQDDPKSGEHVLALGLGGKLCETVWTSDSHEFFRAYMRYPKIPIDIKQEMLLQFPFNDDFKLTFEKENYGFETKPDCQSHPKPAPA